MWRIDWIQSSTKKQSINSDDSYEKYPPRRIADWITNWPIGAQPLTLPRRQSSICITNWRRFNERATRAKTIAKSAMHAQRIHETNASWQINK